MATISQVELSFGAVPPRRNQVAATVTGQVAFTDAEIAEGKMFRLSVELLASDAGEGEFVWPSYPLHTFAFGSWVLFMTPYRVVRAREEPFLLNVQNDIPLSQLDEDPGTEEREYAEAGPDGTFTPAGEFTLRDEVYAQVLLASVPGETAKSQIEFVPWSERRLP